MSRIVPLYIDVDTGKYVVQFTEVDPNFRTYKLVIDTPSNAWMISHGLNTKAVMAKVYVGGEEITPDEITLTDENNIAITFSQVITGELHLFIYNLS